MAARWRDLEEELMYGWRARVGFIIPADNTVMEPELDGLGLPGISFHVARLTTWSPSALP